MSAWKGPFRVLTAILLFQAAAFYAAAWRHESAPAVAPLSGFPGATGDWSSVREYPLEREIQEILRADDTLSRAYVNRSTSETASLFVAFFKTQRHGQSPHSPKNCLPGSGWEPTSDRKLELGVPGHAPLEVNEYIVQKGNAQSVVLYWYQSHGRVIASELSAKLWLVADAIRYRRSDTALVRIIVPVRDGAAAAEATAVRFARAVYPDLVRQFPN